MLKVLSSILKNRQIDTINKFNKTNLMITHKQHVRRRSRTELNDHERKLM